MSSETKTVRHVIDLPGGWGLVLADVRRKTAFGEYQARLWERGDGTFYATATRWSDEYTHGNEIVGSYTFDSLESAIDACERDLAARSASAHMATAGAVGVDADGREVEP